MPTPPYTGRFAPTPSGPLHLGSVCTCLGAFLRARSQGGRFLLRIEDVDRGRCRPGFTDAIRRDLDALGFTFDGEPIVQSRRDGAYEAAIARLAKGGWAFHCACTRAQLTRRPCPCRGRGLSAGAVRLSLPPLAPAQDLLHGAIEPPAHPAPLLLKTRDGLYAYHLACVVDDLESGVTEVVRGADLLGQSPLQDGLRALLGGTPPAYLHLPLLLGAHGKLSKQNRAPAALSLGTPQEILLRCLALLGQDTSGLSGAMAPRDLLRAATSRLSLGAIPRHGVPCPTSQWTPPPGP
ncbi:MAG: tRNA glutamyl-Q(34) synthetase GluQRS [Succinivibrionaceae bacterium]|nr:tRNA glutamyl-Q(34) synthetase GluQRS [Succinivibrionaceae bacterium]